MMDTTHARDEITLKDLLLKISGFAAEIRKSWITVLIFTIPAVALILYKPWFKPITYTANLTFMLREDNGGGGLSSVLGELGGLFGGGGEYQLEKILEIAKSRRIISTTLFEQVELNGKQDFYANHIIRSQGLHARWAKDTMMRDFLFTRADLNQFSRKENAALLSVYAEIIGGKGVDYPLLGSNLNEKTGIMSLSISSADEWLSITFLNAMYANISEFYISKSVEREQLTLDILMGKRDSIENALTRNDYSAAAFDDHSLGVIQQKPLVPARRYQRNNQALSVVYGEIIKNAELAEFALKSNTPFLTILDAPIAPIKPNSRGRGVALVLGLALGLILSSLYIIIKKMVQDALA